MERVRKVISGNGTTNLITYDSFMSNMQSALEGFGFVAVTKYKYTFYGDSNLFLTFTEPTGTMVSNITIAIEGYGLKAGVSISPLINIQTAQCVLDVYKSDGGIILAFYPPSAYGQTLYFFNGLFLNSTQWVYGTAGGVCYTLSNNALLYGTSTSFSGGVNTVRMKNPPVLCNNEIAGYLNGSSSFSVFANGNLILLETDGHTYICARIGSQTSNYFVGLEYQ